MKSWMQTTELTLASRLGMFIQKRMRGVLYLREADHQLGSGRLPSPQLSYKSTEKT